MDSARRPAGPAVRPRQRYREGEASASQPGSARSAHRPRIVAHSSYDEIACRAKNSWSAPLNACERLATSPSAKRAPWQSPSKTAVRRLAGHNFLRHNVLAEMGVDRRPPCGSRQNPRRSTRTATSRKVWSSQASWKPQPAPAADAASVGQTVGPDGMAGLAGAELQRRRVTASCLSKRQKAAPWGFFERSASCGRKLSGRRQAARPNAPLFSHSASSRSRPSTVWDKNLST